MNVDIEERERCIEYMTKNLRFLRKKVGLSQMALADITGCSRQSINAFEGGKKEMSWKTFLGMVLFFLPQSETNVWVYDNEVISPERIFRMEKRDGGGEKQLGEKG